MNNKVPCGGFTVSNGLYKTANGDIYLNGDSPVDVYMQISSPDKLGEETIFFIGSIVVIKNNKIVYYDKAPSDYYSKDNAAEEELERIKNFTYFIRINGFQDFRLWRNSGIISSKGQGSFDARPFLISRDTKNLGDLFENQIDRKIEKTFDLIGGNDTSASSSSSTTNFQIWRVFIADTGNVNSHGGRIQKRIIKLATAPSST